MRPIKLGKWRTNFCYDSKYSLHWMWMKSNYVLLYCTVLYCIQSKTHFTSQIHYQVTCKTIRSAFQCSEEEGQIYATLLVRLCDFNSFSEFSFYNRCLIRSWNWIHLRFLSWVKETEHFPQIPMLKSQYLCNLML